MKLLANVFALVCIHSSIVFANPIKATQNEIDYRQSEMELIGQIGNKVFFNSKNNETNWPAAKYECEKSGLQFAKLSESNEFDYIQSQILGKFALWVNGGLKGADKFSDFEAREAFNWFEDGTNLVGAPNFLFNGAGGFLCLTFDSHHLYPVSCLSGKYRALCQMTLS